MDCVDWEIITGFAAAEVIVRSVLVKRGRLLARDQTNEFGPQWGHVPLVEMEINLRFDYVTELWSSPALFWNSELPGCPMHFDFGEKS